MLQDPDEIAKQIDEVEQDIAQFKMKNVVFECLNYLEQYIKIFSLSFPDEYNKYLAIIDQHRKDYEQELENYRKGLAGTITLSIDPETESRRLLAVRGLENEITHFVEFVVSYNTYKNKFSTLCDRLNQFYNGIVNSRIAAEKVHRQFTNATNSAQKLLEDVKKLSFFEQDSRKREELLNYVIYCDYILFKIALRYQFCRDLNEYKLGLSKLHGLFVNTEYDRLIFKYFIQDLEQIQEFITSNLQSYECSVYVLESCTKLQTKMKDFSSVILDYSYFEEILKLENTLEESAKTLGLDFVICIPEHFGTTSTTETVSVNDIAISVLKLINADKARLLLEVVKSFKEEITWMEFYFLCKIFELYNETISVSKNTIFSSVESKFLSLDEKFPEYSSIAQKKARILNYNGPDKKEYVLLFSKGVVNTNLVASELRSLSLDFVVVDGAIYLYAYFKGFANLERIFGNCITF